MPFSRFGFGGVTLLGDSFLQFLEEAAEIILGVHRVVNIRFRRRWLTGCVWSSALCRSLHDQPYHHGDDADDGIETQGGYGANDH